MVVSNTLAALSFGGSGATRARLHLPRLLVLLGQYPACQEAWAKAAPRVPTWMFLPWAAQIMSLMERPEGEALVATLDALAVAFPRALYFPAHLSHEG